MAATVVQASGDPAAWDGTITGVTLGNKLVFIGIGDSLSSPSITSVKSSIDGDFTQDFVVEVGSTVGERYFVFYYLDNASAGDHTITVVETGIGEKESCIYEISGAANGASEDNTSGESSSSTSHSAGDLTTAGDAALLLAHSLGGGSVESPPSGWSAYDFLSSRNGFCHDEEASGGTYDTDWTTSSSVNTVSAAIAYAGAGAGGGGGATHFPPIDHYYRTLLAGAA